LKRNIFFRRLIVCLGLVLFVATCLWLSFDSQINRGDCGEHPPFAGRLYEGQAVFRAKVLYAPKWNPQGMREPWTLVLVQRRFWGVPWWASKLMVLGHSAPYLKSGGEYFIDADWTESRLSTFLPYVEFRCGSRTKPLSEAALELRLIKDGPPKSGVRIIGRTLRESSDGKHYPAGGIMVRISGPSGSVSTISDPSAVYDVSGLPPGHYSVDADTADRTDAFFKGYYERIEGNLNTGDVWGRDVWTK
jgi:hypothetical protein